MECRTLEIILHSATDLLDVREFGRMKVYAKISISGDPESELKTPVDNERETNPYWNCKITYTLAEEAVLEESQNIVVKLYCKRFFGDRYVGEVNINLRSLFNYSQSGENVYYDVLRVDSGGTFGKLYFSYKFSEKVVVEKPSRLGRVLKEGALILLAAGLEVVLQILFQ